MLSILRAPGIYAADRLPTERLSRRVLLNSGLRADTERYLRRYGEILTDAAGKDSEGYMVAALLGSDPGRAYLLLDAGIGELN